MRSDLKNRKPAKRVCFFIRAANDLDHSAPMIWELVRRGNLEVSIFFYDPLVSYATDYRVRYLQRIPGKIRVFQMGDILPLTQRLKLRWGPEVLRLLLRLLARVRRRWVIRVIRGLARRIQGRLSSSLDTLKPDRVLDFMFSNSEPGVVVFDHTARGFPRRVVERATAIGHITISIPHSLPHFRLESIANPAFEGAEQRELLKDYQGTCADLNIYDRVVLPNQASASRTVRYGLAPDKVAVLGSARYSTEWVSQLRSILPVSALPEATAGRKKVLFLLGKKRALVNWEEVINVIRFLASRRDVLLMVQRHPRSGTTMPVLGNEGRYYFEVADRAIPTPRLIDWADMVVFWGSTAIYDALRARKAIIHLAYLYGLGFDFEDAIPSWSAYSFEHVQEILDRWIYEGRSTYEEAEAALCLERYVDAGHGQVLEAHARFIETLAEPDGASSWHEAPFPRM